MLVGVRDRALTELQEWRMLVGARDRATTELRDTPWSEEMHKGVLPGVTIGQGGTIFLVSPLYQLPNVQWSFVHVSHVRDSA